MATKWPSLPQPVQRGLSNLSDLSDCTDCSFSRGRFMILSWEERAGALIWREWSPYKGKKSMNRKASIDFRSLASCASHTNRKSLIAMSLGVVLLRLRCNTALQLIGSTGNLSMRILVAWSWRAGVASGNPSTISAKSWSVLHWFILQVELNCDLRDSFNET